MGHDVPRISEVRGTVVFSAILCPTCPYFGPLIIALSLDGYASSHSFKTCGMRHFPPETGGIFCGVMPQLLVGLWFDSAHHEAI